MLVKLWVAFALLMTAAQSQDPNIPIDPNVEERLDILLERLTFVENIVENQTADLFKLRNRKEKCCDVAADDGHGIEDIKHRLIGVEGKLDTSTPQIEYLGDQVKKLWVEVRDIRSKGAVPKTNPPLHHEVPSRTHSKEEEKEAGKDSRDLITDAIINSTDALNEMLSNLKDTVRDTLGNSLYEISNLKDELGNEISYLAHTVGDALSNYTIAFRKIASGRGYQYFHESLLKEEGKLKTNLRKAFSRASNAIIVKFKNLKQMMKSELSNLSAEINNSKDATRKAFSNLRQCHCKGVE